MLAGTMPALISAGKESFAITLLPWYRNTVLKREVSAFFETAWLLLFDRFPPPPGDPMTTEYHRAVEVEKENFELALMLCGCHPDHREIPASDEDWRFHLTLPMDRKRRREEWLAKGMGKSIEYQYIVAFEDADDLEYEPETPPKPPEPPIHRHTDYTTSEGRISYRQTYYTTNITANAPNPGPLPSDSNDVNMTDGPPFPSNYDDDDYVDPTLKARMRKRTFAGDNPMLVWMDERDSFVQEFLRLEAPDPDFMLLDCPAWRSTENPYEPKLAAASQAKVRLQLAEEDATAISRDNSLVIHETISPSVLISQGLELQDQQVRLALDVKALGAHATEHQQSQLTERRNRLQ
ncbi:hypothetical protein EYR38_010720 [Pleurotus pulmonarius]|nr:hypothetical protein EYR38_010720 [Pleurotus pulmonarius]